VQQAEWVGGLASCTSGITRSPSCTELRAGLTHTTAVICCHPVCCTRAACMHCAVAYAGGGPSRARLPASVASVTHRVQDRAAAAAAQAGELRGWAGWRQCMQNCWRLYARRRRDWAGAPGWWAGQPPYGTGPACPAQCNRARRCGAPHAQAWMHGPVVQLPGCRPPDTPLPSSARLMMRLAQACRPAASAGSRHMARCFTHRLRWGCHSAAGLRSSCWPDLD
jgi:hypothetical protein